VVYRLDYQIDNGPIQNFWSRGERYEGQYAQADVDLSALAGQNVKFILRVDANGAPTGDRAMWVAPAIVRSGGAVPTVPASTATSTPVPTAGPGSTFTPTPAASPILPTATSTPLSPATATSAPPATTGKSTYINQKYGFQFIYPNTGVITSSSENFAHMILPIFPGTNLVEKYLDVTVFENVPTCTSPLTQGYAPGGFSSETVIINGVQFVKESGQEAGAGQIYDWVAYSTQKGNACTSMSFVLHSTNPSNYPSPPPFYNKTAESAVFTEIMSTFSWMLP
jgi:hypothetical protein